MSYLPDRSINRLVESSVEFCGADFCGTWRSWSKSPTTKPAIRRILTTGWENWVRSSVSTLTRCSNRGLTGTSCVTSATNIYSKIASSSTACTGYAYWTPPNVSTFTSSVSFVGWCQDLYIVSQKTSHFFFWIVPRRIGRFRRFFGWRATSRRNMT